MNDFAYIIPFFHENLLKIEHLPHETRRAVRAQSRKEQWSIPNQRHHADQPKEYLPTGRS